MSLTNDTYEQIVDFIKETRETFSISDLDIVNGIWQALMNLIDWDAARPDQIESFAVRELSVSRTYFLLCTMIQYSLSPGIATRIDYRAIQPSFQDPNCTD